MDDASIDRPLPGESLWRQIARRLAADIAGGLYEPGSRLPAEAALARRFAVNRHTLRRAMAHLAAEGHVRIEQGRGTFVQEEAIDYPIGSRTRFSQAMTEMHRMPGHKILRAEEGPADKTVARNLSLRVGAPVIVLEALSEVDGRPVAIALHHLPAKRFRGIDAAYRDCGSLTESLKRMGVSDYRRLSTRVTAQMPTRQAAAHLKQPATRPILQTENIDIDADGRAIEYGITRFASDRMQLVFEPFRSEGDGMIAG